MVSLNFSLFTHSRLVTSGKVSCIHCSRAMACCCNSSLFTPMGLKQNCIKTISSPVFESLIIMFLSKP